MRAIAMAACRARMHRGRVTCGMTSVLPTNGYSTVADAARAGWRTGGARARAARRPGGRAGRHRTRTPRASVAPISLWGATPQRSLGPACGIDLRVDETPTAVLTHRTDVCLRFRLLVFSR